MMVTKETSLLVQNVQVHMIDRGTGSPVLFLHGAPDSGEMWDGVMKNMERKYRCIAPDLPGFGRSTAPKDFRCTLDDMASFIDALVTAYAIPTPLDLVVTDFGATYGLSWVVAHPEKVRRLAITGGANFFSDYKWHPDGRMLRIPVLAEIMMSMMTYPMFENMMRKNAPGLSAEHVRRTYDASLSKNETRRMMLKLYRSVNPKDFVGKEDRLVELTARIPTLVLWGDKDPFIASSFADRYGKAQVEHFPENGHWLAVEAPEVVASRLNAFFSQP